MGVLNDAFERIAKEERCLRLVQAFEAACRWELPRTAALLGNRLYAMGAFVDDHGNWRLPMPQSRPAPPDDELGANQDADWEL